MVIRRLARADLPAFQSYRSDEAVGRYQGWSALTEPQALAFLDEMSKAVWAPRAEWLQLALADRETGSLIGDIGICVTPDGTCAELGFTLAPPFQGRGLGTEALLDTIGLLFGHSPVVRVICITDARNTPSIRLLERAGMKRVATAEAVFRGETCIEHTYEISRCDG